MASPAPVSPDEARSFWAVLPAMILTLEYFLGGLPRLSSIPFARMHRRIHQKTLKTAPHLAPVFPFTDTRSNKTVRWHMYFVGALMLLEGLLLALPRTRTTMPTFALSLFLPAAGAWSQKKAGLPFWLPITNFSLGLVVYYLESRARL